MGSASRGQGVFSARGTLRISLSSTWSPEARARVSHKGCAKPPGAARVPASAPPCAPAPVAIRTTPRSPACARCPEFPRWHFFVHSRLPLRQELLLLPHHCHICHADARAPRARHPRHLRLAGGAGEDVRLLGLCSQCWSAAWAPGAWVSAPGPRPRGARGCGAHAETGLRGERDVGLTGVRGAGGGGRSGARGGLIAQGHRRSGEPGKRALA